MSIAVIPTVLYSGMMGVVVSALVRTTNTPRNKQVTYLSWLFVLFLIHIIGELYIFSGAYQYAPGIAGFQDPIRMLLGPAFYFYAYTAMFPKSSFSGRKYAIALMGPLLVVLGMIPFVFYISPEQKLALADPSTRDPELWQIAIATCLFTAVSFIVFTFGFLLATYRLHVRHRQQLMDKYSAIEQRAMDWLKVLLVLWGLVWFLYAVKYVTTFFGLKWFVIGDMLPLIEFVVLLSFTHFAIKQLELKQSEMVEQPLVQEREAVISVDRMKQIADKLMSAMTEKELFKDEDLSLRSLSEAISVSENYISETLSQFMKTNFFQFVNSHRVEEAKKLLSSTDMLVTSIAYEVGFKSKSTFNSAFKKIVGTTPTAYKSSI